MDSGAGILRRNILIRITRLISPFGPKRHRTKPSIVAHKTSARFILARSPGCEGDAGPVYGRPP